MTKTFYILEVLGLALLSVNIFQFVSRSNWMDVPLGQFWFEIHSDSLNLTQAIIERYIAPQIWSAMLFVLETPAWIILLILAVIPSLIGAFVLLRNLKNNMKAA